MARTMLRLGTAAALLGAALGSGAQELKSVTQRYCVSCHNPEDWAGGLDLDSIDHGHLAADAESWEKVVVKLRAGMMPPPGKERPDRQQVEAIAASLELGLDAAMNTPMPSATCSACRWMWLRCCHRMMPAMVSTTWLRGFPYRLR